MIDIQREARRNRTSEFFTSSSLVNEMLDKLSKEVWEEGKTFCDPACGDGQFLIWILTRKLSLGHNPLEALKTIYGVDIIKENIRECRLRLLEIIQVIGQQEITEEHIKVVSERIVRIDLSKIPQGALQYDFSFDNKIKEKDIERWMRYLCDIKGYRKEFYLPVQYEQDFNPTNLVEDMFDENGQLKGEEQKCVNDIQKTIAKVTKVK